MPLRWQHQLCIKRLVPGRLICLGTSLFSGNIAAAWSFCFYNAEDSCFGLIPGVLSLLSHDKWNSFCDWHWLMSIFLWGNQIGIFWWYFPNLPPALDAEIRALRWNRISAVGTILYHGMFTFLSYSWSDFSIYFSYTRCSIARDAGSSTMISRPSFRA